MRYAVIGVIAAAGFVATSAVAQDCSNNSSRLNLGDLTTLLSGRYACVGAAPNAQWNELHSSGGQLIDYKLGPGSTVDPSAQVGTYAFSGNNQNAPGSVTYNYSGGGGSFTYSINNNQGGSVLSGGKFSFCGTGGAPNLLVTVQAAHC